MTTCLQTQTCVYVYFQTMIASFKSRWSYLSVVVAVSFTFVGRSELVDMPFLSSILAVAVKLPMGILGDRDLLLVAWLMESQLRILIDWWRELLFGLMFSNETFWYFCMKLGFLESLFILRLFTIAWIHWAQFSLSSHLWKVENLFIFLHFLITKLQNYTHKSVQNIGWHFNCKPEGSKRLYNSSWHQIESIFKRDEFLVVVFLRTVWNKQLILKNEPHLPPSSDSLERDFHC